MIDNFFRSEFVQVAKIRKRKLTLYHIWWLGVKRNAKIMLQREFILLLLVTYSSHQKHFEQNLLIYSDFTPIFYKKC
jgi:hypothetical protein